MEARKLPIGVQDFERLIKGNYVYVDKTEYVHKLVTSGLPYFLSRPRRFGKSLLLSTLRAYFEGKKELFRGLKIEELEKENPDAWQSCPVFYFDFNKKNFKTEMAFEEVLVSHLMEWEAVYGKEYSERPLEERFQKLLVKAVEMTGQNAVVLVDEYDKPLLEVLENDSLEEHNKAVFKGFFGILKSCDEYLQFVFITGVTKFSKVSIFSDLNQLQDISLDKAYGTICGMTEAEIQECFQPELSRMAKECALSEEECLKELARMYDGYHFYPGGAGVYNPFSLLNALQKGAFGAYWFSTGTPTFLVRRMKDMQFDVRQFDGQDIYAEEYVLTDYRADNPDIVPLLYQTGYLTITGYDREEQLYILGFPNAEVKYGFLKSLLPAYAPTAVTGSGKDIVSLRRRIKAGDIEGMREVLTALFASIPYTTDDAPFEHYFQSVLYIVFTLLGQHTHCEVHSSRGRADCILETDRFVYIFEFKVDKSAKEALEQIEAKGYAAPYGADKRQLFKIGVSFDSESRSLSEWLVG